MKLSFWLKSFFSHSGRRSRRSYHHRTTLRRDLQRHGNQPLPAWVEILETRVLLAAVFGSENTISTSADGARSVFAADLDGDGDMDVLSAAYLGDTIAWYENDGSANFTEHTISTSADGAESVYAADVDGDGDMDVLSASRSDDKIAWYENDGSGNFTEHTISTAGDGPKSVFAVDMDGDGDMDVLSASGFDSEVTWHENDGSQNFTDHTISTTSFTAWSVFAADMDGDGDIDVLAAALLDNSVDLYENNGSNFFPLKRQISAFRRPYSVFAADVDGDGDMDALSASQTDNRIDWYENNDGNKTFTQHTISTAAVSAVSVFAADVDGDGDMDVLSASLNDNKIAWYENDGSQNFTENTLNTAADGARSVFAADLDGDGDLDVLSASINDDKVAWYENLGDGTPAVSIDDVSLAEGDSGETDFTFTISIDVASASDVNVNYATADDSATAPVDYTATSDTATIAAGTTSTTVSVKVQGDTTVEPDETFFVNLSNPVNATIADNQGLGTISNDDATTLSIDDVSLAEGDSGETDFTFTISLSETSASDVNVDFATADDSAGAPDDYTAISGTATIAAGATSATVTVTVKVQGDTTEEADETFFVNLSNPVNATIADNQGLGTITNDDTVVNRQIVTPSPVSQSAAVGTSFSFDAIYTNDPLDETLTGLGLRLHFDSTQVQFDGLTNVLQTSLFLSPSVSADTDDFDSNPATDMFVSLAWTDFGGNWPGVGNLPTTLYTANFTALAIGTATMNFSDSDTAGGYVLDATSAEVTIITTNLDVDANGEATALTDGVLIVRYLFGVTGTQLTDGALGTGALRTDPDEIIAFLEPALPTMLDVDANGEATALTDGVLIVRYLFGVTGTQLTDGALGTGATRIDPVEIIAFLDGFLPAAASASVVVSTQDVLIANYDEPILSVRNPDNFETGPNFAQDTFNDANTVNVVTTTGDVVLPPFNSAPLLYPVLTEEEQPDEILTEEASVIISEEQAELDTLFGDLDGSLQNELLAV
jgi:hypothetical protein